MKGFILTTPQKDIEKLKGWICHFANTGLLFCVLKNDSGYAIWREGKNHATGQSLPVKDLVDLGWEVVEHKHLLPLPKFMGQFTTA